MIIEITNTELLERHKEIIRLRHELHEAEKAFKNSVRESVMNNELSGVAIGDRVTVELEDTNETCEGYFVGIGVGIELRTPSAYGIFSKCKKDGSMSGLRLRGVARIVNGKSKDK